MATDSSAATRPDAAERARTLVAGTSAGALATITTDGAPWASLVTFGTLPDGAPVLCLSRLAEHGRNLERDPRASLLVTAGGGGGDPLAAERVTVSGRVEAAAAGGLHDAARAAHLAAVPSAASYIDFADFTLWVLRAERARWVGGYGRMESVTAEAYGAAVPDPVSLGAGPAIAHLNADHADALLVIAQALGARPDATEATCSAIDRLGIELAVMTPAGPATVRVGFDTALREPAELRAATVALTRRARAAIGA